MPVQLTSDPATPLGWSSDGTELLIVRTTPRPDPLEVLSILHADGSESELATSPMFNTWDGATISPDGARVVFVGPKTLYAVDVDTGTTEVLLRSPEGNLTTPTFSPDGTQIAYVDGSGDHDFHVWVMNADGSDAHEIVFNQRTAAADHVRGLAWSPAGERIALGFDVGIYTFAPDGSAFTQVISDGTSPYWSPDGSQIANRIRGALAIADADGSNVRRFGFATSGPWHPAGSIQRVEEPTLQPAIGEPVLHLSSWRRQGYVEVNVYADGRVIWVADERVGNLEQRLTREGVERLRSRAVSTGLFEHDLALGLLGRGYMEVRRGDRSVIVAWGRAPFNVAGLGLRGRFVEATPAQAGELTELEAFFRDPTAWGLPRDMYLQPEITPFVPTHLVVGYDQAVPDWSNLPSPAREIVTGHLESVISDRCNSISIDQAREVVDALVQAGEIAPIDEIRLGFSFHLGPSFVWFDPALPHEVDCP